MNHVREADATYERWGVTQSPVECNQEQCFHYDRLDVCLFSFRVRTGVIGQSSKGKEGFSHLSSGDWRASHCNFSREYLRKGVECKKKSENEDPKLLRCSYTIPSRAEKGSVAKLNVKPLHSQSGQPLIVGANKTECRAYLKFDKH